MKTWAERDENEYALLLEESFTVLIEKIDAIVEEEIDIDAILADLLVQPFLDPEPEAEYFFDEGVPIFIDLGLPVDPQGGSLVTEVDFGAGEYLLEHLDTFI